MRAAAATAAALLCVVATSTARPIQPSGFLPLSSARRSGIRQQQQQQQQQQYSRSSPPCTSSSLPLPPSSSVARWLIASHHSSSSSSTSSSRLFGAQESTDKEREEYELLNPVSEENEGNLRVGESKLVYNPRTGRFSEKEVEEICREEYCRIDEKTGKPVLLTVKEKERIFLDCIQSYYYSGRQLLTDDDFSQLKEDLAWEGSPVAYLNRNETLFLNAMSAYIKGTPIISNEEFDALKRSLKDAGSPIAVSREPKCLVDSNICTVTYTKDPWRLGVLYIPGVLIGLTLWLVGSYELIQPLRSVNPIISLGLGSPVVYFASKFLTENVFFNEPLISVGPCPSCNSEQRIFFGTILGVESNQKTAEFECKNCGAELTLTRSSLRCVSIPQTPEEIAAKKKARKPVIPGAKRGGGGGEDEE